MLYHPRRISVDTTHLAIALVAMALVADDVDILPAMLSPVLSPKAVLHDERPVSQDTHSQDTHRSVKISQDQSRYTQSRQKLARQNSLGTERIVAVLTQVALRDDAEVVVDEEKRRVAAEVAAQQGSVAVVLSCVQVRNDRRIDIQVIAASGAVREALPVVQDGVQRGLGHEKNPDP